MISKILCRCRRNEDHYITIGKNILQAGISTMDSINEIEMVQLGVTSSSEHEISPPELIAEQESPNNNSSNKRARLPDNLLIPSQRQLTLQSYMVRYIFENLFKDDE
jgi:hypothetical protein